jgi:CHAT domain-containing protein
MSIDTVPRKELWPCISVTAALYLAIVSLLLLLMQGCASPRLASRSPAMLQDFNRAGREALLHENYTKAVINWQHAATIAHQLNDWTTAAELDLSLSHALEVLGRYAEALTHAEACVDETLENSPRMAHCLNMKSLLQRRRHKPDAALSHAREALHIALIIGNRYIEAESRRSLGAALQQQNEFTQALGYYRQSLAISRSLDDKLGQIKSLNNIGGNYRARAEYAKAETYYNQALDMSIDVSSLLHQSRVNGNLCLLRFNQSDYEQALKYCKKALVQAERIEALPEEASVLTALGAIESKRRHFWPTLGVFKSLDYYKKSAEIYRLMDDSDGLSLSLNNMGVLYGNVGWYGKAFDYLNQSLVIKKALDSDAGQAAIYGNMCRFNSARGRYSEALGQCGAALRFWHLSKRPEEIWRSYDQMSILSSKRGRMKSAIYFGKQAVNTLQMIRHANADERERYRKTYIGKRMDVYRRLANLLIESDRLLEAEQVLGMLKEEEYFDYVRSDQGALEGDTQASLNGSESDATRKYIEITDRLLQLMNEYRRLLELAPADRTAEDRANIVNLEGQLEYVEREFDLFVDRVDGFLSDKGGNDIVVSELETLTPLKETLSHLDGSVVVLHYLSMPQKLHIVFSSSDPDTPSIYRDVDISRVELNRRIHEFRELLMNPASDPVPKARELYQYLLLPIEEKLEELDVHTLLLYLDGELRYLPIAALYNGNTYVAQKYATVLYTPAVKQELVEGSARPWKVAGLGVSKEMFGFSALPSVVREVDGIVKESSQDPAGVLPGIIRLDEAFSHESFSALLKSREYSVIHIASHFRLDPASEEASELLLGDGPLKLGDFTRIRYPLHKVDLLTLSACETGLGGGDVAGREVESFSNMAQYYGARSVMATLWSVADISTSLFAQYFYRLHEAHGLTISEALRQTQELFVKGELMLPDGEMINLRGVEAAGERGEDLRYSHPYFWAPFVLSGNWL